MVTSCLELNTKLKRRKSNIEADPQTKPLADQNLKLITEDHMLRLLYLHDEWTDAELQCTKGFTSVGSM
ncbi:hypothetical protein Tco_1498848, partial [Tanacetum coccineum]